MSKSRYIPFIGAGVLSGLSIAGAMTGNISPWIAVIPSAIFALGIHDKLQKKHSVLRNYPISGHFRYWIESIAPELRQYIIEGDTEETPFSRAQRSVVYQRSKGVTDVQAFGTKIDVMKPNYEWISHSMSPSDIKGQDFRVLVGANRAKPYSLSVFNISAMSFGSLSANAIRALNAGAKKGNFAHDTGEGSFSKYHAENGGDIIWEIGSGYFGCRNQDGSFSEENFIKTASNEQIKMIEIKLSQGAKPGHGGVLPAAKVTPEIAETRGVPMGQDCVSPASHSAFKTPKELVLFIEKLRNLSGGKPTGFKLCIGHPWEFFGICKAMIELDIYPDFIVVDGAEGGTGAAPMEFTDHMGAPLQEGLLLVHNTLVGLNIRNKMKIGASGKIITAFDMARTFALGADWVNSARGFLFSLGCIQGLSCNTGNCPTGIATQDPERQKALVVEDKAERVYNFHKNSLHALKEYLSLFSEEQRNSIINENIDCKSIINLYFSKLLKQNHFDLVNQLRSYSSKEVLEGFSNYLDINKKEKEDNKNILLFKPFLEKGTSISINHLEALSQGSPIPMSAIKKKSYPQALKQGIDLFIKLKDDLSKDERLVKIIFVAIINANSMTNYLKLREHINLPTGDEKFNEYLDMVKINGKTVSHLEKEHLMNKLEKSLDEKKTVKKTKI